jgi:GT2 family glycosyltransferase
MKLIEFRPGERYFERVDCTVCIANFNGAQLVDACLESIFAQEGEFTVEVIVHDDASTDDSVALLKSRYPGIEIIESVANVGFCISNNRMVARASGEFVLLLNNDAALLPNAVSALLQAARASSVPAVLTLPQYDWTTNRQVDRGCRLDLFYNPVPNIDVGRDDVAYVIGACLWLPRDRWNALGGFPDWMGSIAEDMYLCSLARLSGMRVKALSTSGYRHRQGASFGGNRVDGGRLRTNIRRRFLSERNKTAVLIVCTPSVVVVPLLALHAIALLLEGLLFSLLKRDFRILREIYCAALWWVYAMRRTLRDRRRAAQRDRVIGVFHYFTTFTGIPQKLRLLFRRGLPNISR